MYAPSRYEVHVHVQVLCTCTSYIVHICTYVYIVHVYFVHIRVLCTYICTYVLVLLRCHDTAGALRLWSAKRRSVLCTVRSLPTVRALTRLLQITTRVPFFSRRVGVGSLSVESASMYCVLCTRYLVLVHMYIVRVWRNSSIVRGVRVRSAVLCCTCVRVCACMYIVLVRRISIST